MLELPDLPVYDAYVALLYLLRYSHLLWELASDDAHEPAGVDNDLALQLDGLTLRVPGDDPGNEAFLNNGVKVHRRFVEHCTRILRPFEKPLPEETPVQHVADKVRIGDGVDRLLVGREDLDAIDPLLQLPSPGQL